MTNNRNRERVLRQIMAYDFAQNEMVLYLDTHPEDQRALNEYHKVTQKSKELKEFYNQNFGPLTPAENRSTTEWQWIHGPWPWENQ